MPITIAVQHRLQVLPRVGILEFCNRLWCPGAHDASAAAPTLRPQINHPICGLDHLKVVLDNDDRAPCIN